MLILISWLSLLSSFQNDRLVKMEVNDDITILMPDSFRPMSDDEIASKYFTTKRPMALFTNYDRTVDLGVNQSVTRWRAQDLEIMASFQKSNIYALYDDVHMIQEGIKEVDGRKFAYFEFVSVIKPDEGAFIKKSAIQKYTYIQYTMVGNESLVFNFSCPAMHKAQWADKANKIMESIAIKSKK